MDAIKCIYSRVSTRDFNTREVFDEDVNDIVRAAMAAPVGMGRYALKRITVMKNEEFLEKVTAACPQDPARRSSPFYGAKTVIIVSAETKETPDIEYADAACMVYAMALAARAKGIASVYLWGFLPAVRADKELLSALHLPEGYTPLSALAVGYTDEPLKEFDRPRHEIAVDTID